MTAKTKRCNICGEVKPTGDFRLRKRSDGSPYPRWACRSCENAHRAISRRRELHNNPEAVRAKARALYQRRMQDPEYRAKRRAYKREHNRRIRSTTPDHYRIKSVETKTGGKLLPATPLGRYLVETLDNRNLAITELAELVEASPRQLSALITGERKYVTTDLADRITLRLGDSIEDVYPMDTA